MNLANYHTDWKKHHGETFVIDGNKYRLTCNFYDAIFPYPHKTCQIYANVPNKDICYDLLGHDDFSFDLFFKIIETFGVTDDNFEEFNY